jgi:hypothetical protein
MGRRNCRSLHRSLRADDRDHRPPSRSQRPERRPAIYRIAATGAVVLLACSLLINAQGGVLRSSICWNLKAHDVESVDQNPARVWSWTDPQVVYAWQAVRTEGLDAALTRCPSGTPTP